MTKNKKYWIRIKCIKQTKMEKMFKAEKNLIKKVPKKI